MFSRRGSTARVRPVVIQDLDGAVSEPTRRRHVVVLSAATAAVSIILFFAIIAPPVRLGETPQAASPSPSPNASFVMTVVSNPLRNLPLDLTRSSACPDGSRLTPPYFLTVEAGTGRILAGAFDGGRRVHHLVTLNLDAGTGKLTVTCVTNPVVTGDTFDQTWEFDAR